MRLRRDGEPIDEDEQLADLPEVDSLGVEVVESDDVAVGRNPQEPLSAQVLDDEVVRDLTR